MTENRVRLKENLTAEEVRRLFSYDEHTGQLLIRTSFKVSELGRAAGTISSKGYRVITIRKHKYQAHNVIYLHKTGTMPPEGYEIDHINNIRSDNSWSNLRLATRSENIRNANLRSDNTTGIKGVTFRRNKYDATITLHGKQTLIGHFATKELAATALTAARIKLHGEFAKN